jgi:hypothetical protein
MCGGWAVDELNAGAMSRWVSMLMGSLLVGEICLMGGCGAPAKELDLQSRDPSFDHQKIARYYHEEAARLRKVSEDMTVRASQYEHLFGLSSDWVQGTTLLAESYRAAAREHERLAGEHQRLAEGWRKP